MRPKFNRKICILFLFSIVLGVALIVRAQDIIKSPNWQIQKPEIEIRKVDTLDQEMEEKTFDVEVLMEGENKIAKILENEILSEFPQLNLGFESISLDVEATKPAADKTLQDKFHDFVQDITGPATKSLKISKTLKKSDGRLEGEFTLPLRLRLKTLYKKTGRSNVKQSISIANTSSTDLEIRFTVKTVVKGNKVSFSGKSYDFPLYPLILEESGGGKNRSGDYSLVFEIPSAVYRGRYNWSDVKDLNHALSIQKKAGSNVIILNAAIHLSPGAEYLIDPTFGVDNEIPELRTINSKTFDNGDGSYTKEINLLPVHYRDNENVWQDINTAIESLSEEAGFDYQNRQNNFQAYFRKNPAGSFVKFRIGSHWILSQLGENSDLGKANNTQAVIAENTITYPEIYDGVDLKYTVSSNQLLEEFIVHSRETAAKIGEIQGQMILHGLRKEEQDKDKNGRSGKIDLESDASGEKLIFLPKPLMYELNNPSQSSDALRYQLEQSGNDYLLSKVLTNEGRNWLADPSRNYPVVIDATDTLYPGTTYWAWKNTNATAGYTSWTDAGSATETIFTSTDYTNVGSSDNNRASTNVTASGATKYAALHYSFDLSATMTIAGGVLPQGLKDAATCYDATTDKFYIFGGYYHDGSGDPQYSEYTYQYDPVGDTTTTTDIGDLPVKLRGASCASKDADEIYIFGGYDKTNDVFSANIYKFNPSSPNSAITDVGDLPQGLEYAPAAYDSYHDRVYLFGGYWLNGGTSTYTDEIVEFNPNTGLATNTGIGNLLYQLAGASAAYKDATHIYIFGGYDNSNSQFNQHIYLYNPSSKDTNATDSGDDMSPGRRDTAAVYDSNAGKFYIFGGFYGTDPVAYVNTIAEYSPGSAASAKDSLPFQARGMAAAFSTGSNKTYLFGGYDNTNSAFSTKILYYNPGAGYTLANLTQLKYTHEGYYTGNAGKLYYYADSGWTLDQALGADSDSTLTKTISSGFTDYLDSESKFHFSAIVEITSGNTGYVYTDLAKLEVTYNSPPNAATISESSTGSSPTNVGSQVTFSAASISDPDTDNVTMLICDGSGVSGTSCAGTQYCSDGPRASGSSFSCGYTTLVGDAESNTWTGWACDANSCTDMTESDGTFKVNHRPAFTVISDSPDPVSPGQDITFSATASDADTDTAADTVSLYVCKADDFTGTACGGGGTWCIQTGQASNPSCSYTVLITDTPGTKNYYANIIDSHNFASSDNPRSGTFEVAPSITFSLNDVAIGFGTFSTTTKRYATADATGSESPAIDGEPTLTTISTNAASGAIITARSKGNGTGAEGNGSAGLYNSSASKLIAAAASSAVVTGTEGFGLYLKHVTNTTGTLSIVEGFDNDGDTDAAITTTAQTVASATAAVNATVDVALDAAISTTTTAGNYTDTITVTATGKY